MKRIVVLVVVQMLLGAAALAACSSTESSAPSAEAGSDVAVERTTDATAADAAVGCVPQPLQGLPRYVPARPWYQDACTKAQVAGYVSSCFYESKAVCDAFKQQNPTCFACLNTEDTDPTWGAWVRFEKSSYSDRNFPGCVANTLGETGDAGCGAAQGVYEDCRRLACRGCLPVVTQADFDALTACGDSKETTDICAASVASVRVQCADHMPLASDDPINFCLGTKDMTGLEYLVSLSTRWCMAKPDDSDGGDAGTD